MVYTLAFEHFKKLQCFRYTWDMKEKFVYFNCEVKIEGSKEGKKAQSYKQLLRLEESHLWWRL